MNTKNTDWPHWELIEEIGIIVVYFSRLEIYMLGLMRAAGFEDDPWTLFGKPKQIVNALKRLQREAPFSDKVNETVLNFIERFDGFRQRRNDIVHSAWLHKSDKASDKNYYRVSPTGDRDLKTIDIEELRKFKFQISNFYDHIELLFDLNSELPEWIDMDVCPKGFESLRPYIVMD